MLSPNDIKQRARAKLIVALDVPTAREAREFYSRLRGHVGMFKVGSQLFSAEGPAIVRELVNNGDKVFLDLKFHDIPNTVAAAGVEATRLGVSIFNVHAAGGTEMLMRTRDAVDDVVLREGLTRPALIAVTVLTSSDDSTLKEVGVNSSANDQVVRLAKLTEAAGLDGVVASPQEISVVRAAVNKEDFLLVIPGVRPSESSLDDQRRTMSPQQAIATGANYLVIGRPILKAADPVKATEAIVEQISLVV